MVNSNWYKLEALIGDNPITSSFSGGRTSAVMTKLLCDKYGTDLVITFANTGCEDTATLDFVHECETTFNWPVVWLEAVVTHEQGVGISHKVVDYETASRNGEPFRDVVSKYGIFNRTSPACTARLKTDVMTSYLDSLGFYKRPNNYNYFTAIGIRSDEVDRISVKWKEYGWVYPLCVLGYTKRDVALEIKNWGFDLQIPHDAFGNCTWCWKKSLRKHLTLIKERPSIFDFPKEMEEKYGTVNGDTAAAKEGRRYWFGGHKTVDDLFKLAETTDFTPYTDDLYDHAREFDQVLDIGGSCGDSCEIGADE